MLIDPHSLAALLQCHEESVRRWIRTGKLQAACVPGGMRVDLHSVNLPAATRDRLIAEWRSALDRAAAQALRR